MFLSAGCDKIFGMNKSKLRNIIIKAAIPLVILAILIIVKVNMTQKQEFRLSRYVIVTTTGFDSNGKASLSLDDVGIYTALADGGDTGEAEAKYKPFVDSLKYSLDRDTGLSNGDTISLTVTYDSQVADKLGIDVGGTTRSIKVEGLEEGTLLDAFADVKIITGGISPYVYVTYANESDNEYLASLEYVIDKTSNLAIGDEVTIRCNADEKAAADKGYYFSTLEMKYTIEEADRYVNDPADVDKKVLKELSGENIGIIEDEINDTTNHMSYEVTGDINYLFRDSNETSEDFAFQKAVLVYNDTGYEQKHENYILLFYKGNIVMPTYSSDNPNQYLESWFCFRYSDAVISREGEWSMATNDPKERYICGTDYESTLEAFKSDISGSYTYTDIPMD